MAELTGAAQSSDCCPPTARGDCCADDAVACTLEPEQQAERSAIGTSIAKRALIRHAWTDRGAAMAFRQDAADELRRLIEAESRCCAFLRFSLEETRERVELVVEGPADARPVIRDLFGLRDA